MNRSRLARRIAIGCGVLALLAFAFVVFLGFQIAAALSQFRMQIKPGDVAEWVRQATVITLEQGAPEQKLEVVRVLGEAGAAAREYSPALLKAALADEDP